MVQAPGCALSFPSGQSLPNRCFLLQGLLLRGRGNAFPVTLMSPTSPSSCGFRARSIAQIVGASVVLLSGVALAGWFVDINILKSIIPGSTPLKPNIAAGCLLSGAALLL